MNMDQKGLVKISNTDKKQAIQNSILTRKGWGRVPGLVITLNFEFEFESDYDQTLIQIRPDFLN